MADPLSQLRQFHVSGREIKEHNGYIIFGDHGWPKSVHTNYQVYSIDDDKTKKEYYTLECLLYFLKNMDVAHHHYVKQAGRDEIPVVHRPDRKNILAYLKGEQQSSPAIDKNAPIPPLRLSAAEIYKKDQHLQSDPTPSISSQNASQQNQHDSSMGDTSLSSGQKRPHDPEMEKQIREKFAAKLNEPSHKKLATVIPSESAEKTEKSAAISKFGAEKLAALRLKHQAVKRTTIIEADLEVSKTGAGAANPENKEAELLIAMDSDQSKLIRSKEKIWRTRTSILQAQSKNFAKTVLPLTHLITRSEDPNRKSQNQMPTIPHDMHMNPYHQQMQQQQQQTNQRNAYNRYDQERFNRQLDMGFEIDTKKSFVSGGATNGASQNQPTAPNHPQAVANQRNSSQIRPPNQYPPDPRARSTQPSRPHKRTSTIPIIIIPAITSSIINMHNASAILQDLTFVEGGQNKPHQSDILIQRKKPDGTHAAYKILDNPAKLDAEDWNRVVAVFVQGPAWQFKGWPWGGAPVEIFSHIKAFHLKWDEQKLDDNVAKWNVHVIELSRNRRHLDKANLLKFWSSLDHFMVKYKSFLKF